MIILSIIKIAGPIIFIVYFVKLFQKSIPVKSEIERKEKELENRLNKMTPDERRSFLSDPLFEFFCRKEAKKIPTMPNAELAKRLTRIMNNTRLNTNVWLNLFLLVTPVFLFLFYSIFREIQFFVIGEAKYILVDSLAAFGLPVGFFTLGSLVILEPFIGRKIIVKRLGKENYPIKSNAAYWSGIIFLIIVGIISLFFVFSCIFNYTKVTEDGIYVSHWMEFKEKFYPWEEIKAIYYEKGTIGTKYRDNDSDDPYRFIVLMKDGNSVNTSYHKNKVVFDKRKETIKSIFFDKREEMFKFIGEKTKLPIETKIYDEKNKEYVD